MQQHVGAPSASDSNRSRDLAVPRKQERAYEWMSALWASRLGRTSVQVLNEYYVTVTRKLAPALPAKHAREDVGDLCAWAPAPISAGLLDSAFIADDAVYASHWPEGAATGTIQVGAGRPEPNSSKPPRSGRGSGLDQGEDLAGHQVAGDEAVGEHPPEHGGLLAEVEIAGVGVGVAGRQPPEGPVGHLPDAGGVQHP